MKAGFDTNILIDYPQGVPEAREELGRFTDRAAIRATAQAQGALLVSRNSKAYPKDDPGARIPYRR